MWTSLEIAKLLASLATPLVVASVGYVISMHLKDYDRQQQREEDERRKAVERKESAERDEIERRHTPHIEIKVDLQFLGKRGSLHLARITVAAANRGQVIHKFSKIVLRVRGIKNEPFTFLRSRAPHAAFPHKIIETNMVQEDWNFIFIEPGVTQQISLNTLVPAEFTFVLAHVLFEYEAYWPHTADTLCAVPASEA